MTVLSFSACQKELLEPIPESILTTKNFYQVSKDMDKAVLGIYNRLQSRKPTDFLLLEIPTDNLYASTNTSVSGANALDVLAVTPDNELIADFWIANYSIIFRANAVLTNIDKPLDYKALEKDQFTGEAKFMRALAYFEMVRLFGGVPNVTTLLSAEEAKKVPRASEADIYNLVIDDLQDAIKKLPVTMVAGRASKGAAIALLGKVYVYQKKWVEAEEQLSQLFKAPFSYTLLNNFADFWKSTNENNKESVFAITYLEGSNGHNLSTAFIPNGGVEGIVSRGSEVALPSWSLNKQYIAGDTRKVATITDMLIAPNSKPTDPPLWYPYVSKYAIPHTYGSSGLDLPVIRFADVVLLYAETLYGLGRPADALIELNKVRERAFAGPSKNYILSDIANPADFSDKLFLERRLEFAYESERWYDLVRSGKYLNFTSEERAYNPNTGTALTVPVATRAALKYLPIPTKEIDKAQGVLGQNDGYN